MSHPRPEIGRAVLGLAIGYALALAATGAAFVVVRWPVADATTTLAAVLALAFVQAVVHFRFFLHIRLRPSSRDELVVLMFATMVIALMVAGTLVLLANLHQRMM